MSDGLRISWLMLPGQRPYRELHWLSLMDAAHVMAVGSPRPAEPVEFVERPYRRITGRFTHPVYNVLQRVDASLARHGTLEIARLHGVHEFEYQFRNE